MITLGIDLAAEPKNTAACRIDWHNGGAEVQWIRGHTRDEPLTNQRLTEWINDKEVDATGIDAPFGWPTRFLSAVTTWSESGRWEPRWDPATRRELRLRATDRFVGDRPKQTRQPLSVSADSIAMCAMRACALLEQTAAPPDRINGPVVEVYPAAALREWDIDPTGYKQLPDARQRVLTSLTTSLPALTINTDDRERCIASDHAIDALICSLVTRAANTKNTLAPPAELLADAGREGWIHLPASLLRDLV